MFGNDLDDLAALIRRERDGLLSHVPQLMDELAAALKARSDETIPEALSEASPPAHGLQRVQDGFDIEEVVAEYNILRGCIHDLAQANGLNLLSELGIKLERRAFDLWPLVEALVHDLHPVAHAASTRLVNRVPDDLVVYADAGLLRRVFQNVIANAIAYTPRGEVMIGARQSGAEGTFERWVSDNGAGIPPERLENVFDKPESDPDKDDGWGLGLAIVETFVEAHDGSVSVESTEGLGSTFRFTLPPRQSAVALATS